MLDFEILPEPLAELLKTGPVPQLVDVREPWEIAAAPFPGAISIPMGEVPGRALVELDPDAPLVVICHHGVRSLTVTSWLRNQGYEYAQSLQGGIDGWSRKIDATVPRY